MVVVKLSLPITYDEAFDLSAMILVLSLALPPHWVPLLGLLLTSFSKQCSQSDAVVLVSA